MQGSLEEKEKCMEKLGRMEKFLPFLDFMIDKIKKKSGEISLGCQLSKLEGMRSMIAEKNGRYTLDAIIKVEDIIEKLIAKLDYKEQCNYLLKEPTKVLGNPKINEELLKVTVTKETTMASSVSVIPSTTTTTISVTNATSLFEVTTVDSRPKDSNTKTVDLNTKTLNCLSKNNTDSINDKKLFTNSLERSCDENSFKTEVFNQNLELNLDKDLDGFELTDCQNLFQINKKNTTLETATENSGKLSSQVDLLSSSREKLLKSLQKKLNPPSTGSNNSCQTSGNTKVVKISDSQSISASSLINKYEIFNEEKTQSEISVAELNSEIIVNCSSDKCDKKGNSKSKTIFVPYLSPQSLNSEGLNSDNKSNCDLENNTNDINSKQKLREKLSADICEVYRVPGKSIGGSLRSLKEAKEHKKTFIEEEELFKPDKITGISKSARSSTESKEKEQEKNKYPKNPSNSKNNEKCDKSDTKKNISDENEKEQKESQKNKRNEKYFTKQESIKEGSQMKNQSNAIVEGKSNKKISTKLDKSIAKEKINKSEEMKSCSDKKMLEVIKENMDSLPNHSKLKPSELRKAQPSLLNTFLPESSCFSLLNEDEFQDLDEFMNDKQYSSNKLKGSIKTPTNSTSSSKTKNVADNVHSFTGAILKEAESNDLKPKPAFIETEKQNAKSDKKIHDIDNFSNNELLDDTAFAQKLIEDTTETACSKKKEFSTNQAENKFGGNASKKYDMSKLSSVSDRDPRKKKLKALIPTGSNTVVGGTLECKSDFENQKNENGLCLDKHQSSTLQLKTFNQSKVSNVIHPSLSREHVCQTSISKESTSQSSENKYQGSVVETNVPDGATNFSSQEKPFLHTLYLPEFKNVQNCKSVDSKLPNQYVPSRYPKGMRNPINKGFSEAKSYAEYKRLKLKQQKCLEKFQCAEEEKRAGNCNYVPANKKQRIITKGVVSKDERQKTSANLDITKSEEDLKKKTQKPKKQSSGNDDLISPLEKLYQSESKPSTGRGYGLQNFKIPKKLQKNNYSEKEKEVFVLPEKCEQKILSPTQQNIVKDVEKNINKQATTTKTDCAILENSNSTETCKIAKLAGNSDPKSLMESTNIKSNCQIVSDSLEIISLPLKATENDMQKEENSCNISEVKSIDQQNTVEKCEIVECDSSIGNTNHTNSNETKLSNSNKEKSNLLSKDEITQEFVEALIRKSFQSGEGKLLLAQAKLFEEFTRKLNSKKLKTIQKIINSESDSDSSSSNSSSESDKKKKRRSKKLEGRNSKRKKKKIKKTRKQGKKQDSETGQSSEEEEEEIEEEEEDSREEKISSIHKSPTSNKNINRGHKTLEYESRLPEKKISNKQKIKKKQIIDFGLCISKRKRHRKQDQRKLLEQILNEPPKSNSVDGTLTNSDDVEKEIEQKPKTKSKGKVKTELDRLHDDIRSMFICEGVVTATGQRMCRILKESGGNMKNLDIVKESAKMVEEEKLKKVEVRETRKPRSRNVAFSDGKSRSRSYDKLIKLRDRSKSRGRTSSHESADTGKAINLEASSPLVSAENFKKPCYVVMHKVDLNNFGFGEKISEGCLKFNLTPGSNVAYRGENKKGAISRRSDFSEIKRSRNVYLGRNKRKCLRLKNKVIKQAYKRKSLAEVVKHLPLKMAKMKHLEIVSCKKNKRKKDMKKDNLQLKKSDFQSNGSENLSFNIEIQKNQLFQNLSCLNLLDYAFDKKKSVYSCKLCYHQTSNITRHYKTDHAESEVLISRLSREEAQKAVTDATENNYNVPLLKEGIPLEVIEKVKPYMCENLFYKCRMCSQNKTTDFNSFFFHVSGHTGEYRYSCPSKGCSFSADTREYMKIHILSRHPKSWRSLYRKIIELFPIPTKCRTLFGYLCSECNFVQIFESNLKNHIQKSHSNDGKISIIKIDMSDKVFNFNKKKDDMRTKTDKTSLNKTSEELCETKGEVENENFIDVETIDFECYKDRDSCVGEVSTPEQPVSFNLKKLDMDMSLTECKENEAVSKEFFKETFDEKSADSNDFFEEVSHTETQNQSGKMENLLISNMRDESITMKNVSHIKDADIVMEENGNQVPTSKFEFINNLSKNKQPLVLKIGPLEVQIFGDSDVLYNCHVKDCIFSTKIYDLFEKHVRISHLKIKWYKECEICLANGISKCGFPTSKLSLVLQHLKFHENIVLKKNVYDDQYAKEEDLEDVSFFKNSYEPITVTKEDEETFEIEKSENVDSSYPPKPLLRVRNFFGDRLSTPKENFIDNEDIVTISGKESSIGNCKVEINSEGDSPKMFTIENVRSLQAEENSEVSDIRTEIPLTKNSEVLRKNTSETVKPVVVRSCPSRQIAIQPDSNSRSIESNLKLVKTSTVNPVVLGTMSNVTPIRILSSAPSPRYKFSVQSVMVSASNSLLTKTNTVSVIRPVPPLTIGSCNSSVSSPQVEDKDNSLILSEEQEGVEEHLPNSSNKISKICSDKNKSSTKHVCPKVCTSSSNAAAPPQTSGLVSRSLPPEEDINEIKEETQKISRPIAGNKSVKDAKIYQEMLTKTKLCHLFKCMAVECSFTCNDENIFTQHLGLHEAQRRMKNQKTWKTVPFYSNSKLKKAFNWQQCAYCREVLPNRSFALSRHVIIEHGHCIYQCAYCFYRAVSQSYVEIHQNLAHGQFLKQNSRIIYKCKSFSRAPSPASALEKQGRRQSVRPYHCDQCGKKFFITQEFMNHLTTEHQSVTAYTCHICKNLCFKADRLLVHYKLHSYCTYQCAYCLHGTETEKEMVFHLCNFHFSQPAYMYVRALADNQKCNGNQLDSLKVIQYESDTLNPECIEEADLDEQTTNEHSKDKESHDLSIIVAELGITAENEEGNNITPLFRELACIGNKNCENLSVKSLLPNAQFSSENDNSGENCSVLISSGLSFNGSEQNEEKEISIPLGQLNVETVTVHSTPNPQPESPAKNLLSSDKNMKLNEIIINIHNKEKSVLPLSVENSNCEFKEKPSVATAIHKMPPVVLTRITDPKNVYPSKSGLIPKKTFEDSFCKGESVRKKGEENILKMSNFENKDSFIAQEKEKVFSNVNFVSSSTGERNETADKEMLESQPVITNVRSLSTENFEKNEADLSCFTADNFPKITEVCSLSNVAEKQNSEESSKTVSNIQLSVDCGQLVKPPIDTFENFSHDDKKKNFPSNKINESENSNVISQTTTAEDEKEKTDNLVESPEVIILENEKNVVTVTIDSEDEKETESLHGNSEETGEKNNIIKEIPQPNETIRKEMELLRNQIANETECLLIDDTDNENSSSDLSLIIRTKENKGSESLLSPIEEAICSLNKKLEQEGEKSKEEEKLNEPIKNDNEASTLPRTRSSTKEKTRKVEATQKNESGSAKLTGRSGLNDIRKNKFKNEFSGTSLYICGNEKCSFAAENESDLKDHLYVCDTARDSTILLCPHCSRQIKQINAYIEHLKHHGEKKYSCGLCSFKSAVESSVARHIKQKHKHGQVKSIPCDPPKADHLIFYPKNYKLDKVDFEVNGYSPGDEDKLPLQAVYQVNVKCAKCPYFTKVRSNMVRHLKIHVKSAETEGVVVVPSTAPTNPVPCLDAKERMFDKMTNLAASSQLAQAREKIPIETLAPEEEAKLPHFIPEQMRYKCCLPDCNYITVDDGMLKHHIKALHGEINYYSCPHCKDTVHVDVRHVTLDKIGQHLKYHDSKLYRCAHCIYFHYQKAVVEKHTLEKHPDKRYFVHVVREPKGETSTGEELQSSEQSSKVWKCGLCDDFYSLSKVCILEHLVKLHNTKSKYKCKLCDMKSNHFHAFFSHFASKHGGEKVSYLRTFEQVNSSSSEGYSTNTDASSEHFDTTPLWQRGAPRVRHIRGILIEEAEVKTKKNKKTVEEIKEANVEVSEVEASDNSYFCPLCSDSKPFCTKNADIFRSHLYQELNYQQFACILCGKMFVDKKDYEKHHAKFHQDKPQSLKQTKEDGEITFWVDKMIAKQKEKIESKKRRLSEQESNEESRGLSKKKRKND